MKKNTHTALSKKIVKYGALSLALAGIADASGQIVFTDIDPDHVGGISESFAIDFDGDGVDDVIIRQKQDAIVQFTGAQTSAIEIEGDVVGVRGVAAPGLAISYYPYPSNLSQGDIIGPANSFLPAGGYLCFGYNYQSSFCAPEQEADNIIGARFDISGETHFGWIKLADQTDSFIGFTVDSFAYETRPNAFILAGDTGVDTGTLSLEDNAIEGLSSYVANNALTITARNPLQNVTIHNLNGQEVISQNLGNTSETINLNNLSTGMYIATVRTEGKRTAIKFVK